MRGLVRTCCALAAAAALPACSIDRTNIVAPTAPVASSESADLVTDDYEVATLSAFGGTHTHITGIDNSGAISGYANEPSSPDHDSRLFISRHGIVRKLGTLGGAYGRVLAMAPNGTMTGLSARASGRTAFTLWWNDLVTDLSATYPAMSIPHAIGANGHIVGGCEIGSSPLHACMAHVGITHVLEPPLHGVRSEAWAVNESGVAVGERIDSAGLHAMLWRVGHSVELPGLSSTFARARSINDRGEVVGESIKPPYRFRHAVLWREGMVIDLDTGGGLESSANDINDDGVVVGSVVGQYGNSCPFVWRDGRMRLLPLPTLPIEWSEATAINDRGEIVGFVMLGDNAQVLGIVWRPR